MDKDEVIRKLKIVTGYLNDGHPFALTLARRELDEVIQLVRDSPSPVISSNEHERSV